MVIRMLREITTKRPIRNRCVCSFMVESKEKPRNTRNTRKKERSENEIKEEGTAAPRIPDLGCLLLLSFSVYSVYSVVFHSCFARPSTNCLTRGSSHFASSSAEPSKTIWGWPFLSCACGYSMTT